MKVLLAGGHGMLGTDIAAAAPAGAPAGVRVSGFSHRELDITDRSAVARALDEHRPDCVINAAGYTQVDRAESEPELAERVNAVAPGVIGEECRRRGITVVHFSTDYVFAGEVAAPRAEGDVTGPVSTYGRTKLEGERRLLGSGADALVIRTAWLFGRNGKSFPRTMRERARAGRPTRVVDDQHGRPTYTVDLAAAAWGLVDAGTRGIVHATNGGEPTTWFGIAREVFALEGAAHLVSACTSDEYPTPAPRPRHSLLDIRRLESVTGPMPTWEDALGRFLGTLRG